jgi:hypothetical protein
VPLYVEELTKAMTEPGAAHGVEAIPASLADSLMGRLDRLSAAKEGGAAGGGAGTGVRYPLLAAMAGMDEAALRQGLGRLVDAEILFARGEPPGGHVHLQARADPGDGVPVAAQAHAPAAARVAPRRGASAAAPSISSRHCRRRASAIGRELGYRWRLEHRPALFIGWTNPF